MGGLWQVFLVGEWGPHFDGPRRFSAGSVVPVFATSISGWKLDLVRGGLAPGTAVCEAMAWSARPPVGADHRNRLATWQGILHC